MPTGVSAGGKPTAAGLSKPEKEGLRRDRSWDCRALVCGEGGSLGVSWGSSGPVP